MREADADEHHPLVGRLSISGTKRRVRIPIIVYAPCSAQGLQLVLTNPLGSDPAKFQLIRDESQIWQPFASISIHNTKSRLGGTAWIMIYISASRDKAQASRIAPHI